MPRMQLVPLRLLAGSLIVILADQGSKLFFSSYPSTVLIPGILAIRATRNSGIAFSLPLTGWPLIVMTGVILIAFCAFVWRYLDTGSRVTQAVVALIVGGGVGNLIDRLLWGSVRDFVALSVFPVFNAADVAIAAGAALLLWKEHTIRHPRQNAKPMTL